MLLFSRIFCSALIALSLLVSGCGKNVSETGKYLVVNPRAGLANRMRAMASAKVMADVSGRKLVIDWQEQPMHFEAAGHIGDLFKTDNILPIESLPPLGICDLNCLRNPDMTIPGVVSKYYNVDLDQSNAYTVLPKIGKDTAKIVYLTLTTNFKPEELSFDEFLPRYKEFYKWIKPIPRITKAIDNFVRRNFQNRRVVGVHYRSWTTTGEFPGQESLAPKISTYIKLMQQELAKDSSTMFYVSADHEEKVKEISAGIGEDKVITYPVKSRDRKSLEATIEAAIEWYLLGHTEFIIGTFQSSFSEEAAFMTKEGRKINIGPQMYPFHSIMCFDDAGNPILRPNATGKYTDPCLKYSIQ